MAKLFFSVDSAVLTELGERLVESVHVALLELVKNSYDADASTVKVSVIPIDGDQEYEICVSDNGVGMTLEQVKNFWMRIATTNKAFDSVSAIYGRTKSGSKGIGRFSCRRLGSQLEMTTTAKLPDGRFETTEISVNWDDYIAGKDVTEISCQGETIYGKANCSGTKLIIRGGASDEWSKRGWGVLKRRLMLLVSNRGCQVAGKEEDPGFDISLTAPDFEESSVVNPREQLMDAGWGRCQLVVDEDGKAKWSLVAKRIGNKQITMPDRYLELAGTTADFAILPDDKKYFRNPSVISLERLRLVLDDWGGIYVRMDGIRVPPYGEGKNDWLEIDRDRGRRLGLTIFSPVKQLADKLQGVDPSRALLTLLSAKSFVGEINAASPTGLLEMKASREGFVGERSVAILREVVRFGVDWSTIYRDYFIRLEQQEITEKSREEFAKTTGLKPSSNTETIKSAVSYVRQEVEQIASTLPAPQRKEVIANIAKATDVLVESGNLQQTELHHLRLIASTSSLLLIFQHEVRFLLSNLGRFELRLNNLHPYLNAEGKKEAREIAGEIKDSKEGFDDLLKMTSLLSIDQKDAPKTRLALASKVAKTKKCFRLIRDNYGIRIDLSGIPRSLKVGPIMEAELFSVFLNVLSNSIKSVIASGGDKKIAVQASVKGKKAVINILDTGLGISADSNDVFTAFIADPEGELYHNLKKRLNHEDKYIIGTGTGLGLSIVKEIVTAHGGTVGFVKPEAPWTANLEIVIP
jgi:signal transduction histidine kinase